MVKLDNGRGCTTWVHESRLEEYLARGYKLPSPPPPPAPPKKPGARRPRQSKTGERSE